MVNMTLAVTGLLLVIILGLLVYIEGMDFFDGLWMKYKVSKMTPEDKKAYLWEKEEERRLEYDTAMREEKSNDKYDPKTCLDILDILIDAKYNLYLKTDIQLKELNKLYPEGRYNPNSNIGLSNSEVSTVTKKATDEVVSDLSENLKYQLYGIFKDQDALYIHIYSILYTRLVVYTTSRASRQQHQAVKSEWN